ncbi:putative Vacuolar protein sorting-associated protein [Heracleum sosnowskyi]|uniref:Vacuolar protein sorting-associated protein n=1 Tax=Heracleum sosnowskyi TaxID=360622 RepID=A0AAD8N069_9APIA|nr:putative Vacuolar protein sorting-associated protein [Heracleum sosnowskyi]
MFEGLVRQLIVGYLGRYIKDIHKEQLKITLWNEEVKLENVELILEAFDYLQLPCALKEGRVGRLSIKIPWKKLGWDPIIISLEDVLVCACQRNDEEWSRDAVERREFAGKKAKLAAAELSKLSRRFSDDQAGNSFISFITAKILDGIQVSIRNVHVLYRDMLTDGARAEFGLKFSSLTLMKQNPAGVSSGKARGNQVTKLVEVQSFEIYCRTFQGTLDGISIGSDGTEFVDSRKYLHDGHINVLAPVDVSMSLLVNRPGKLESDAPQYSIDFNLTGLVISLDEMQLQEILNLYDYLSTCCLRERYGQYRPWASPLSKKPKGWQISWWQYAQQSVLSDVCKRLRKTSWKYLGERLSRRHKYVKLYKTKLECLRQELLLDDDVLWELEQIEKEADIDEILDYRSVAECEIEEYLEESPPSFGANEPNAADFAADNSVEDEQSSSKPRGWLNWLSRGMLGAGGTDDSSQFSGVVSDEVIKDIYEATKFYSVPSLSGETTSDEIYLSSMKFNLHQITATLRSMKPNRAIADLLFEGVSIECKMWEKSAVINSTIKSAQIVNPSSKQVILLIRRDIPAKNLPEVMQSSVNIQVDLSPLNHDNELSVKVMLQSLEVTFDSDFVLNVMELYRILQSFTFQQERVLLSLNGIDDDKVRLLSKAEYILSSRKRVMWDVQIFNNRISVLWENANADPYKMVLQSQALSCRSIHDIGSVSSDVDRQSRLLGFQLSDLYDWFEIKLDDFEINVLLPFKPHMLSVLDKLGASLTVSSCILPDESILKSSEVSVTISSLLAHFSLSRYGAILELISNFSTQKTAAVPEMLETATSSEKQFNRARTSKISCFSVVANLGSASLLVDLENGSEHSCILKLSLQELNVRLSIARLSEWWIGSKALRVIICPIKNEEEIRTLCSAEATVSNSCAQAHETDAEVSNEHVIVHKEGTRGEECFLIHYQASRNLDLNRYRYSIWLNDADLHIYPYIIGQLVEFSDKLAKCGISHVTVARAAVESSSITGSGFEFQRFGFSNYYDRSASEWECIPVDQFPFVTIKNDGPLLNLESSYVVADWRDLHKVRDRKIKSPSFSGKKGSEQINAPPVDFISDAVVLPTSLPINRADVFAVELNLINVRLHFHDSASVIGTVTVPTSKSSINIYDVYFDVLISCEGLTLSSSWCTQLHSGIMWGPSLPDLSSILNVRVRKEKNRSLGSSIESSFSVQHVSCILPPEYLAILLGYFSLTDWKPNAKQQSVNETSELANNEVKINLKFEVLDSSLFVPAENDDCHLLKLNIQQLLCTFIENCSSENILKDIPVECLVPVHKVNGKNNCLNIFAHDLSLQLLFLKDDASDFLVFNKSTGQTIATLISQLNVDVWIRLPCKSPSSGSSPLCIMARICNIQLMVEGIRVLAGYEALLDIINQFSTVDAESQGFTSDVQQFLLFKRSTKEKKGVLAESSSVVLTEIKCSFNSVSVKLYSSKCALAAPILVFEAKTQLLCYASLKIDEPHYLDILFSTISLISLINSVRLVECCSSSVVSELNTLTATLAEIEAHVSLPPLDIWFYSFDWSEFIDLCSSYFKLGPEIPVTKVSVRNLIDDLDQAENEVFDVSNPHSDSLSNKFASQTMKPRTSFLHLKSENITITARIPVRVSGEVFGEFSELQVHKNSCDICEAHQYGFIVVALESKSNELVFDGKTAKVKCNVEKTNGTVELCKEISERVWRFFQIFQVNLEADISKQVDLMQIKGEVRCDSIDIWISHHICYIFRRIMLESSSQGSSPLAFGRTDLNVNLRKLSLLLIDGKQCSNGPLVEVLLRNSLLFAVSNENNIQTSISGDLQVNYNNIHKVLWEPFVEPWKFNLSLNRRNQDSVLFDTALMADISLSSTSELNLNITESFVEVVFRAIDMIADAWGLPGLTGHSESPSFFKNQTRESIYGGRYAPYRVQNLTSLPLAFHVIEGPLSTSDLDVSALEDEIVVQPGSSIPIYIDETPEEQLFRHRPAHSSERLSDKQFMYTAHRYVVIRLEGTSIPSAPISMDLVGLSCFHVDFSKSTKSLKGDTPDGLKTNFIGKIKTEVDSGYVVPVVVDVSVQRYTKLIRLYSTVVLLNATSTPFEVRFDIPFGVSPKMLDPIYPGQEFPLPLHLAEAGRMRWRPVGNSYLWSEAYYISNIVGHESNVGVLRSVVCYPSHPSSDPFRFCLSVHDMCLPASGRLRGGASEYSVNTVKQSFESCHQVLPMMDESKKCFLHLVTISSPLVVSNFLPVSITLEIESGGVTRSAILTEVETSFFHIDSSHDLAMVFTIQGYGPSVLKFPRAEKFGAVAKFSGTKFSSSETISFNSDSLFEANLYVSIEMIMDAASGAREIYISVPFLLYNCTAFPLVVSNCVGDMRGCGCTLPSCYDLEEDLFPSRKDGLSLLCSDQDFQVTLHNTNMRNSFLNNRIISTRKLLEPHSTTLCGASYKEISLEESKARNSTNLSGFSSQSNSKFPDSVEFGHKRVSGCMYSPDFKTSSSDIKVQVSRGQPKGQKDSSQNYSWSGPFSLAPSTGSIRVPVPHQSPNAGYMIAVTSTVVTGPISGRTRMITFQPRYVISNACSRNLYYKQKGTDSISYLQIGQHSQIRWSDYTLRDLLVSLRFDEPSWQWSGCFLPEHLGDTQLKMRNYVSGALNMIRVEVQNADVLIGDEKISGSSNGNSGTNLILISDDDTGYMPYRVDNFSKERLRIYQQKCEIFETIVHTYTSCPYAWDEPCLPHRLIVEVPGERVLGSYALDEVQEFSPVYLCATSEKPERTLLVYVQAEGAVKVLNIVDSSCHILNDLKGPRVTSSNVKGKQDHKQEASAHYKEKLSFFIPFIGISVMNSYPQELLYVSARNMTIDLARSVDQETFSIQLSSLQIDNQLHSTPYPVILSFEHEIRNNLVSQMRRKDDNTKLNSDSEIEIADSSCDPVFTLAAAKWRNTDTSLVSFEYISLKVADFHLELELEVIQSVSDFFKTISSRFNGDVLPDGVSMLSLTSEFGLVEIASTYTQGHEGVKNADQISASNIPIVTGSHKSSSLLPSVVPIGAPWQQIYLLARTQKKIYVELLDLAPINLTLSFSSSPWMLMNGVLTSGESVIHRGLMALADIEGAQIHLNQLLIAHQLASWESIQVILTRHYKGQFLHEIYKVFGSAGVIGNPMGFARSVGQGIRDFLSVPAKSLVKNPAGLFTGMAQGTTSLLSNTVYAISDATTQFSRAAHKGIVAFTFDDQSAGRMEKQQFGISSHSKGVINEILEGLTGLLQSPIRGAEKHGLPGILSGIALGVTGLVARPAASILEVTGKTALSIRNRSKLYHMGSHRLRVRLPRPLSRESPLSPYSWEDAVGTSVLSDFDSGLKLKDEILVLCRRLKQGGKFVIITERLVLLVSCSSLVDLGKPRFRGIPADPEWVTEAEIGMDSVIHADADNEVVHIVGSSSDTLSRQKQYQLNRNDRKRWNNSTTPVPLYQTNLEFICVEEAENFLQVLLATVRKGKEHGWGYVNLLHQSNLK